MRPWACPAQNVPLSPQVTWGRSQSPHNARKALCAPHRPLITALQPPSRFAAFQPHGSPCPFLNPPGTSLPQGLCTSCTGRSLNLECSPPQVFSLSPPSSRLRCHLLRSPFWKLQSTPCPALLFHFSITLTCYIIHLLYLLPTGSLFLLQESSMKARLVCFVLFVSSVPRAGPGKQEAINKCLLN